MKRKLPSLDKRYAKHRPLSPDEAQLWREVVEGKKTPRHVAEKAKPAAAVKPEIKDASAPASPPSRGKKDDAAARLIDSRTRVKLRRGTLAIEATLDLHGHTQASAHAALLRFIEECQSNGARLVRIITGKGRAGGGALVRLLPCWLDETPLRGRIIAYDVAGPRHGGEGAWYVRIRKQKPETR